MEVQAEQLRSPWVLMLPVFQDMQRHGDVNSESH